MGISTRLAAFGLVVLVTACGAEPVAEKPPPPMPVLRQVSTDMAASVSAFDAFGLDLLTAPTLADEPNLVVSPVSVSLALQMIGAGAAGETATQIAKVLHLPEGAWTQPPALDQTNLKVSNTAWTQRGLELKPDYRDTLRDTFGARLNEADFEGDPHGARGRINQTVADQTAGKITDLFPRDAITRDTRLVLTNALYLKAEWAQAFPGDRTAQEPFTREDGSTVTVPMMHNDPYKDPEATLGYAEGPGYQAVTLPYRGGELAFTVIVTASVEAVRSKGVAAILSEVRPSPVDFAMPRFTARTSADLTDTLEAAGMPTAFSDAADFSGITDDVQLRIDSVRHKTFVQVGEQGTEAAAATGIDAHAVSAPVIPTVTVDRPFLFVITDTTTGAPLFLGRIADPTSLG
jgi:serpin B